MPVPEHQQNGLIALVVAIAAPIGAFFGGAGVVIAGWFQRKTTIEIKQLDRGQAYTDNLQEDVTALRLEVRAYHLETDNLRAAVYAEQLKAVDHEAQIARNKIEIEQMRAQIEIMKEDKARTKADYEAHIVLLKAEIADKQAEIDRLQQYIVDMEVIGVGEVAPPKRQKEV